MTQIHTATLAIMADIAKTGIAKLGKNKDQNYNFRGIEAAMNDLSPILIKHKVTITPTYTDFNVAWSESKSGTKLRFVTLKGLFKFTAEDGSSVVAEAFGEGMDSSDKATTKAQSVAYRTALFQNFVVPTMALDPELWGEEGEEGSAPDEALAEAEKGTAAYEAYFKGLTKEGRAALARHHEELKAIAAEVKV